MRQQRRYQWVLWFRRCRPHLWMPLLLGIVATIAVLNLWQQLLIQEQLHIQQVVQQPVSDIELKQRSPLLTVVLWGGLASTWLLVYMLYLGLHTRRQAQRTQRINQQLQNEIIYRQQVEVNFLLTCRDGNKAFIPMIAPG